MPMPAGEFVRVAVDLLGQEAHVAHHFDGLNLPLLLGKLWKEDAQGLGDDLAYVHARVERGQRVLKDDLQVAALLAHFLVVQAGQVLSGEKHLA
jgi:hypothetical protein